MKETPPTEVIGYIIDGGQEAKKGILDMSRGDLSLLGGAVIVLVLLVGVSVGALGLGLRQRPALRLSATLLVAAVLLARLLFPQAFFHYLKSFARWVLNIPAS